MYIWELEQWPVFGWDAQRLAPLLAEANREQGRLMGKMEALGFELRNEAYLQSLTQEVVKSSEIEGEKLDSDQVRSSIARLSLRELQENQNLIRAAFSSSNHQPSGNGATYISSGTSGRPNLSQ